MAIPLRLFGRLSRRLMLVMVASLGFCAGLCTAPQPIFADAALDDYNLAVGLYKQKRWELAAESFQKFVQGYKDHEKTPLARLYLGLTLVNAGKYTDARNVLRGYVKDYPESRNLADAMYRVAECSYLLDDLKAAEEEFQAFLDKHPKNELAEWGLPYLGDAQIRLGKHEAAAASFQKSLELFPSGRLAEDSKFGLARSLESRKKLDEAITLYRELAANRVGTRAAQAQLNLAACYFDSKRYPEAAKEYDALVANFPASPLVSLAQLNGGYSYYQLGDFRKAVAQFDLAAKDKKHSVAAGYWRGVSFKSLGEFANGAAALKAVYEADPKGPLAENALFQWADCELRAGQHDSAREKFLEVVSKWPKGDLADDSLHFAGEAALLTGKLEDAQKLVDQFQRDYAASPLRFYQDVLRARMAEARGRELDAKGDVKAAQRNYQAAVTGLESVIRESKIPRTIILAQFHLARTLQRQGEHARVVATLAPVIEDVVKQGAGSEFVDALVLQGRSYQALKKYEEAGAAMTQYLALRPQGEHADQALATRAMAHAHAGRKADVESDLRSLAVEHPQSPLLGATTQELAELAFAAKDWEGAGKLFLTLVNLGEKTPYHAAGLSGLAWTKYQQKQFPEADADFVRVVQQHADDAPLASEASFMHGECLREAGKLNEAVAAFAQAFEKYAPVDPAAAGAEESGTHRFAYQAGLSAARGLRALKRTPEADAAYEKLTARYPHAKGLELVLNEWALLNYESKNYARSDEVFRKLVKDFPESPLADNALLSLAESQMEAGDLDSSSKVFRELVTRKNSDDEVREVALFHLVGVGVERRKWDEVVADAGAFAQKFPQSSRRPEVAFYLGEAQLQRKDAEAARKTLEQLKGEVAAKPDVEGPAWQPRVWVLLAEALFQLKAYDDLVATVEELRKRSPQSDWLYQADEILGRGQKNQAKWEEARAAFQRAISHPKGEKTETAAKSQFLIAETYLQQKNYEEAQREYLKVYHLYKFPEWQAPSLYQAGVCAEQLSKWKDAAKFFEDFLRDFPKHEFAEQAKMRLDIARKKGTG